MAQPELTLTSAPPSELGAMSGMVCHSSTCGPLPLSVPACSCGTGLKPQASGATSMQPCASKLLFNEANASVHRAKPLTMQRFSATACPLVLWTALWTVPSAPLPSTPLRS